MRSLLVVLCLLAPPALAQESHPFPADSGAGTQGPAGSISWPLEAPNGSEAEPSYNFLNDGTMGCFRGLAATWGYDSLVCQSENFGDTEGAAMQLSSGPPNLFYFYATDLELDGATIFGNDPSGTIPWAGLTLLVADMTTGTGATAAWGMTATTAGAGGISSTVTSSDGTSSTTIFNSDDTSFTDPILAPYIDNTTPGYAFGLNPLTGLGIWQNSDQWLMLRTSTGIASLISAGSISIEGDGNGTATYEGLRLGGSGGAVLYNEGQSHLSMRQNNDGQNRFSIYGEIGAPATATERLTFGHGGEITEEIFFDSQATGTGTARPVVFKNAGVDLLSLDATATSISSVFGSDAVSLWMDANDATYDNHFGVYVYDDATSESAGVNVKVLSGLVYASLDTNNNSIVVNELGGVIFNTYSSKPTCAVGYRGSMWRTAEGAGDADTLEVCLKDSADVYAWLPMARPTAGGEMAFTTPTATTTTSGTPIKALGTTTLGVNAHFDMPANNRLRYTGTDTRFFHCEAYLSLTSGTTNKLISMFFAENGTVKATTEIQRYVSVQAQVGAAAIGGIFELAQNDYIEVFVDTDSADTDVTLTLGNVICKQ